VASNFPTSLDNFTNPSSGNTLDSPSHSLQHSDINDAVEAIEAKLGIGASPAGSATSGQVLTAGTAGTSTWSTPAVDTTAWTSWTPTFTNWAIGNGTIDAKYKQIGKTVFFRIKFTLGSTTTKSAQIELSLPVTANAFYGYQLHAINTSYGDFGTDDYFYTSPISTTAVLGGYLLYGTGANQRGISPTAPFTWATNDTMLFHGFYEAA
jgi:hypothetical protein